MKVDCVVCKRAHVFTYSYQTTNKTTLQKAPVFVLGLRLVKKLIIKFSFSFYI